MSLVCLKLHVASSNKAAFAAAATAVASASICRRGHSHGVSCVRAVLTIRSSRSSAVDTDLSVSLSLCLTRSLDLFVSVACLTCFGVLLMTGFSLERPMTGRREHWPLATLLPHSSPTISEEKRLWQILCAFDSRRFDAASAVTETA